MKILTCIVILCVWNLISSSSETIEYSERVPFDDQILSKSEHCSYTFQISKGNDLLINPINHMSLYTILGVRYQDTKMECSSESKMETFEFEEENPDKMYKNLENGIFFQNADFILKMEHDHSNLRVSDTKIDDNYVINTYFDIYKNFFEKKMKEKNDPDTLLGICEDIIKSFYIAVSIGRFHNKVIKDLSYVYSEFRFMHFNKLLDLYHGYADEIYIRRDHTNLESYLKNENYSEALVYISKEFEHFGVSYEVKKRKLVEVYDNFMLKLINESDNEKCVNVYNIIINSFEKEIIRLQSVTRQNQYVNVELAMFYKTLINYFNDYKLPIFFSYNLFFCKKI
jgi:hypothetical protein